MPLIKRFMRGESGVTVYGLIAAALMLIGVAAWVVATTPLLSLRRRSESIH
jgi:Flp pilus assembly pilin Flp